MDESSILTMTNGGEMITPRQVSLLSGTVQTGAILYSKTAVISSAAVLSGINMLATTGNIMQVYSGGTAQATTMNAKTSMTVNDGGYASDITLSGGTLIVSGGTASDILVEGAIQINDGGVVDGVTMGPTADDTASIAVNAGGVLINAKLAIGVTVNSGGLVTDGSFEGLALKTGASASKIYLYGYTEVASNCSTNNIYICNGGAIAKSACVVSGIYLDEGGTLTASLAQGSGARAYITEFSYLTSKSTVSAYITGVARNIHASITKNLTKPTIHVANGGIVYDSLLDGSGVIFYADSGSLMENCSITNGAVLNVLNGAVVAKNEVTSSGTLKISSGATIKGLRTDSTALVSALKTAKFTLDFDMEYYDGGVMINDLSVIGASQRAKTSTLYYSNYGITYKITLDEIITGGVYKLAGGLTQAYGLLTDKTFTVYAADGTTSLGTMQIGTDFTTTDGTKYSLATVKTGSTYELDLTVSNVETPSLQVTTADDIIDAHDGKISFREAMTYAKRGGVSTAEGHVGEACITFDSSIKSITLGNFNTDADGVSIDTKDVTVSISEVASYSTDTVLDNANLSYTIAGASTEKYLTNGISTSANVVVNGDTSLTIDAGDATVSRPVIGAALIKANGKYTQSGKVSLTIKSGTYSACIYGGAAGVKQGYSAGSSVGSTCITVDATSAAIAISGNIYAGGNAQSLVYGDAQVIFKGSGSTLNITGAVIGDSNYSVRGGKFLEDGTGGRFVKGDRIITFNGFTGDFNARGISGFDKAEFSNSASVNFTNTLVNFTDISEWDFSDGSAVQFAAGIKNSFAGDTINLSGAYADSAVILDGNSADAVAGFDALAGVNLFGDAASWDSAASAWSTANYKLELDSANNDIVLSKLA